MTTFEHTVMFKPKIRAGIYRHYKGGLYFVPGIVAIDEATGKASVPYYSLSMRVWIHRFHEEFTGTVLLQEPNSIDPTEQHVARIRARFERLDLEQLKEEAISCGKLAVALASLPLSSISWRWMR